MSRWLKSVNNLLETLDGKAETVAAVDGQQAIGKLLENGREVVAGGLGGGGPRRTMSSRSSNSADSASASTDDYSDEDYEEDEEECEDEQIEESEDYEEEVDEQNYEDAAEEDGAEEKKPSGDSSSGEAKAALPEQETQQQQQQQPRHNPRDDGTVSDLSSSHRTADDDDQIVWDEREMPLKPPADHSSPKPSSHALTTKSKSFGGGDSTGSGDFTPNVPNRQATRPKQVQDMALGMSGHENPLTTTSATATGRNMSPFKRRGSLPSMSPKIDVSPRFPRRSIEGGGESSGLPTAGASFLEEEDDNADHSNNNMDMDPTAMTTEGDTDEASKILVDDASAPPRFPLRKPSYPHQRKTEGGGGGGDNAESPTTEPAHPSATTTVSSTNRNRKAPLSANNIDNNKTRGAPNIPKSAPASAANPKATKEYQKLKEKLQNIQSQLSKTTTELKMNQTQIKSLQTHNQTLESKLEAAQSEIQAQADELRRAGERMEKDRLRAQEEREDLLDEQDEELGQLKEVHQKELDGLRSQYESQIAGLTDQLQSEETRRRQEGGDYTQELQDAVERERDALKQLNVVTSEKTQFQSMASKLELQQTALQGKLESALQSVKTAADREREAEDKLDATMSLHSRQISRRQAREAELEKTIFELGTALTVALQKQQNTSLMMPTMQSTSEREGESSFKHKYVAAAEEVDTFKVQLNMETMRREALQEELNDISKERTEEVSSAQARQRLHDRKVSELESTISRLQATVREQKSGLGKSSGGEGSPQGDPTILSQELQTARREVESLTTQLLRHQNMAETSKSEILALKGRLQAATSRAEQAEQSLHTAQSLQPRNNAASNNRLYEMEGGGVVGGTMRRRVKGGTGRGSTRTIRAALQMSPGRNNHPIMEQVAMTLDALDSWMVDTGAFLRHEPLARLAFMLYLLTLHLWSFALVVFHTTEQPHADFGSMDNNPRHWRAAAAAVAEQSQT